jgi:hypothetical protein
MKDPAAPRGNETDSSAAALADQAVATGKQAKDAAADLAGAAMEAVKRQAGEAAGAAKDIAYEVGDRLQSEATNKKHEAANYVGNLADTMRRAAQEFEPDIPLAATYIRSAAAQVDNVSFSVRNGDLKDLLRGAQSFARSQPTAFLGLTVLAGFGLVRLLKSSAQPTPAAPSSVRSDYPDYH